MIVTTGSMLVPWLYIYGPFSVDETKCLQDRFKCCEDIANFLNGGNKPKWLDDMKKIRVNEIVDLDGTSIRATGPMIDADPPNLNWIEDDTDESYQARINLINKLVI